MGPPELVVAFFSEFVFKRKFNKNVPIGTDVRTQIYVRDTNNDSEDLTTVPLYLKNNKQTKQSIGIFFAMLHFSIFFLFLFSFCDIVSSLLSLLP